MGEPKAECRPRCGACCIAISIQQPFYGMPSGKPAGEPCVHLDVNLACELFGDVRRPDLCEAFAPTPVYCGDNREQAMARLAKLEQETLPLLEPVVTCE